MDQPDAFAFEQAALKAAKRLADHNPAAGGYNAVPGNGLAAWASGHGSPGGAGASRKPYRPGQLAVGDHAPFGDALD